MGDLNKNGRNSHYFVVVEFCHEKVLGIVLKDWIRVVNNDVFAYWPPYYKEGKKLEKAIRSKETPNTNSWTLYPVTNIGSFGK